MAIFDLSLDVKTSRATATHAQLSGSSSTAQTGLTSAIAALVTSDAACDALVTAANAANSSNDATTEIDAIQTGYVAQYATIDGHLDNAIADLQISPLNAGNVADAKADLVLVIAAIVTADSALDTLVSDANTANTSNDATTEINAIQTQYAADLLAVDATVDLAVAEINSISIGAQGANASISFDTIEVSTTGKLRLILEEIMAQALRSGQVTRG